MDVLGARKADFRVGDHQIAAIIADGSLKQTTHAKKLTALLVIGKERRVEFCIDLRI